MQQQIEVIEDQATARAPGLRGDSAAVRGITAVETAALGNVIELDPQLRRAGAYPRTAAAAAARINPRAIVFALRFADLLVAAAAGTVAYRLQRSFHAPLDPTIAFTALAVMAMLVRFPDAEPRLLHDSVRRPLARRMADAALRSAAPFALSLLVVLALVPADHGARGPLTRWLTMWAAAQSPGLAGSGCAWQAPSRIGARQAA